MANDPSESGAGSSASSSRPGLPTLTVFTPTFNRAYILPVCYDSLKRQTSKDFLWLIVDDGSTDGTEELVASWMAEGAIPIRYHKQENQGMHGAHNAAYERIETELNVCIDSDDYMPEDAVEAIVRFWREHGSEHVAGIAGLDVDPAGRIIGTELPERLGTSTLTDLYGIHKVRGDKKLVYRSQLTRQTPPYPLFEGENYGPLSYKYVLIDQLHPLLLLNKPLCVVEYLPDGSSMNIIKQYRRNPQGFAFFRKTAMKHAPSTRERLREAIHYVSSSLMSGNRRFLQESPCRLHTVLAAPAGILLYLYLTRTSRSTARKVEKAAAKG
ncbi:glycosyltransferase family A protein [Gorillibacterium sp. CAU 1737]|uniref:glycosyltransferase family 2 protein n=1 Tax=Gorillibacterium sp. CAU 1737 TaxID=3140362 RepID=UPI00326097DA